MLPAVGSPLVPLLLAVIPAAVSWWSGQGLRAKADDPALPELLFERWQLVTKVFAVCVVLEVVLGGRHAVWGVPLLAGLLIVAGYPVRRRVLGETWGLGAYVWHTTRSIAGGFGFWIALCLVPFIVQAFGRERWWASLLLVPILLAWEHWYPRLWLRAHSAEPLARPDLVPRFDAIARAAGGPPPDVYRVGVPGSRWMNAVALPSVKRPAVAMGTAVLDLLEPDEIAAIFAHEVAHFDHFTPRALRRLQLVNRLLIIGSVALTLAAMFVAPAAAPWTGYLWPAVVMLAVGRRAATSQKHETESDLRAAALCGDPEAVVRGLVKLHVHARIPRRWSVDFERMATHPSLVRRIQAIRASAPAAGAAAPVTEALDGPTLVHSTREGSVVVFDNDRAYWLDGVPADAPLNAAELRERASSYRAISYQDLIELRVAASGGERVLRARNRRGDTWSVPLASDDVARVQRALDVIDLRLGQGRLPSPTFAPALIAVATLAAAMMAAQVGLILAPIILTLWRASAASLASLGAVAIGRAALGALEGGGWWSTSLTWAALGAMALLGVAALYLAASRAKTEEPRTGFRVTTGTLGALTALAAVSLVWQAITGPLDVVVGAPLAGTVAVALLGTAAPLFTLRRPAARRMALGSVAVAALIAAAGVDWGALARRWALPRVTATVTPVADIQLPRTAQGLRLSPGGTGFMVTQVPAIGRPLRGGAYTLSVGEFGGASRNLAGIAADFVDDEHVLVLAPLDSSIEVRLERADAAGLPVWADTLAMFGDVRLQVDRAARAWTVAGDDYVTDGYAVLTGRLGGGEPRQLAVSDTLTMMSDPIVLGDDAIVIAPALAASRGLAAGALFPLSLFGADPMRSDLWRLGEGPPRLVASVRGFLQCGEPENGAVACVARHVRSASLWTIDASGGVEEVARLPMDGVGPITVGPGLVVAAIDRGRTVVVGDLAARRLTSLPLPDSARDAVEARFAGGYLATLSHGNGRSAIRLYRVESQQRD